MEFNWFKVAYRGKTYLYESTNADQVREDFFVHALVDEYNDRIPFFIKLIDRFRVRGQVNKRLESALLHYDPVIGAMNDTTGVFTLSKKNRRYKLYSHADSARNKITIEKLDERPEYAI